MASRTNTRKARPQSPTKTKGNSGVFPTDAQDYAVNDKDLLRGLSEKEVEIEHLKTAMIALNEKVEVSLISHRSNLIY